MKAALCLLTLLVLTCASQAKNHVEEKSNYEKLQQKYTYDFAIMKGAIDGYYRGMYKQANYTTNA
jgi:hypothetical protein